MSEREEQRRLEQLRDRVRRGTVSEFGTELRPIFKEWALEFVRIVAARSQTEGLAQNPTSYSVEESIAGAAEFVPSEERQSWKDQMLQTIVHGITSEEFFHSLDALPEERIKKRETIRVISFPIRNNLQLEDIEGTILYLNNFVTLERYRRSTSKAYRVIKRIAKELGFEEIPVQQLKRREAPIHERAAIEFFHPQEPFSFFVQNRTVFIQPRTRERPKVGQAAWVVELKYHPQQ